MRYDCGIGCSALCSLGKKATRDKVLAALVPFKGKGKVIKSSLAKDEEEGLKAFIETHPEATSVS